VRGRLESKIATTAFGILLVLGLPAMCLTQAALPITYLSAQEALKKDAQKLSQLFPFADSNKELLDFNKDFVLRPHYDEYGSVLIIEAVPKFYLNDAHPDWVEPDALPFLDRPNYTHLLALIDQVRPLGRRHNEDPSSMYVTNSQFPATDEYDNAVVKRSMYAYAIGDADHPAFFQAASFSILFFHPVSGTLDSLQKSKKRAGPSSVCSVSIDGKRYLTTNKNCNSLKAGRPVSIHAAGPLDDLI
jgi:hypothetical protein